MNWREDADPQFLPGHPPPRGKCGGKLILSKRSAQELINLRTKGRLPIRRHRPTYLRAYECPHCGGWHLTSQEQRHP